MKRIFPILLVLFLLAGCAVTPPETVPATEAPTTDATTAGTATATAETTTATTTAATTAATMTTAAPTTVKTTVKPTTGTTAPRVKAEDVFAALSEADRDCPAYDLDKYMAPLWEGNVVYNESVLPLFSAEDDEKTDPIALMYPIDRVLSVRNSKLNKLYVEGVDYEILDGYLHILPSGSIRIQEYSKIYQPKDMGTSSYAAVDGGWQYFAEGGVFHDMQIAVSYIHTEEWTDEKPEGKSDLLPKTQAHLKGGKPLRIVFLGASTALGANASKMIKAKPLCPAWTELTAATLQRNHPKADVTFDIVAKGGEMATWGYEHADEVIDLEPDLVVIEYGMNDATHKVGIHTFVNNTARILDKIGSACPDCEFVVMSSWCPNNELINFTWDGAAYCDGLMTLEREGVAEADMWRPHRAILAYKQYYDMTGNNVNHPNDFLTRLLAQVMVKTIDG